MFEVQIHLVARALQSEARRSITLVTFMAHQAKKLRAADARAIGSRLVRAVAAL